MAKTIKRRRGSGITAYVEEGLQPESTPETPALLRDFFAGVNHRLTFDGAVANDEDRLKTLLVAPETRQALLPGEDGEHSASRIAREILVWVREVRAAIRKGDASRAAAAAYYAGKLSGRLGLKQNWERPALSGKASIDGAREGGRMRARPADDIKFAKHWLALCREAEAKGLPRPSKNRMKTISGKTGSTAAKAINRGLAILRLKKD